MVIPVEIAYTDQRAQPALERTQTKDIARHGGIIHLGRSAHTRVVWSSAPINGAYEVGVEVESPENVWGVPFVEADWTADRKRPTECSSRGGSLDASHGLKLLDESRFPIRDSKRQRIFRYVVSNRDSR